VVPDAEGHANSEISGIERSSLNTEGWYVYGALDDRGVFLVQSLAPRALLRAHARRPLADARDARRYANKQSWRDLVAAKGDIIAAGSTPWSAGDRGLLVHTYGGIGGDKPERSVVGPFYFGHFAYGLAEAVDDPLSGELRFELTYYQVYTQNPDGLIAGKLHWSRYMGDRQYGWAGIRPVCEAILRLDAFAGEFEVGSDRRAGALDAFMLQLEAMAARYRIGDGTGGTFVTAASNCSQDSNRALFGTLRAIDDFIKAHPAREQWMLEHPDQADRYKNLIALLHDLRKQLQPFGSPRQDWEQNEYNLGGTAEDAPIQNFISALGSWRSILPRLAFNTVVDAFLRHDATTWVIGTDQIGGERPDIAPVVPFTI
jgi:predicted Abi (CAAX) family protease